jgi:hypothetical protein
MNEGWRELGHTWLLLSIVPILAWAISNWWTGPMSVKKLTRWFAGLPLTIVATHSLMAWLVLSSTEAAGWNSGGHEALLLAVVPIVAWAIVQRWRRQQ